MFSQSKVSCNETIKRRTKKLFDKSRRLTSIFSESFNVNSSPIASKFRKSFQQRSPKVFPCAPETLKQCAPECTTEVVKKQLPPETPKKELTRTIATTADVIKRSPSKWFTKSSKKVITKLPSKTIEELPTKVFIDIFKFLPAEDLPQLRLVSKRFDGIIQNHALELPKISTEALNLSHPEDNEQKILSSRRCCKPLNLENIDRPLRHLKTQSLSLTGVTVTSKLIRFIHRSIKYRLEELRFIECSFCIKSNELAIMVKQWEPKFIHFNNCKWNSNESTPTQDFQQNFLDDLFFSMNRSCDFLCVDFSSASPSPQRLGFTDKFSKHFTESSKLPSTIIFNNCLLNITAKTLKAAVQRYIDTLEQNPTVNRPNQYQWSFGAINDTKDNILSTITCFQEYIFSQHENLNKLEIVFELDKNCPLLLLSVKYQPESFAATSQSSTLIEASSPLQVQDCKTILWEETDGLDFPAGFF